MSLTIDECDCHESVMACIEGSSAHQGGIEGFTENAWSLIEVTAVQNSNDSNALEAEKTRAWIRYQQCR